MKNSAKLAAFGLTLVVGSITGCGSGPDVKSAATQQQSPEVDQPEPPPGTRLGENLYVTPPAETLREEPFGPIDPVELARGDSADGPWRLEASSGKYEPGQLCLELFLNNDGPMGAGGCGRPDEVPATSTGGITPAAPAPGVVPPTSYILGITRAGPSRLELQTESRTVPGEVISSPQFEGVAFFLTTIRTGEIVTGITLYGPDTAALESLTPDQLPFSSRATYPPIPNLTL